tara:strand:+ start:128 stop:394 length:267 start_codon:yes stop_codon:yes gene_type:complete
MANIHPLDEWRQKQKELIERNKAELKAASLELTKRSEKAKPKGLGDTVEEVFKKTGISYIAKKALGEDCGCDKRKEKLNKMFPYKNKK